MKHTILTALTGIAMGLFAGGAALGKLSQEAMYQLSGQAANLFHQANEQVQSDPTRAKELYTQAILRWQKIIDEGEIANGYLYYNIANAYLLKGHIGEAILNYRRAERLGMAGPDLVKNLAFARSKRVDQVPVRTEKRVLQTLFFWHYDLAGRLRFLFGCISWAVFFLAAALRLWWRRSFLAWLIGVSLFLLICFGGSVCIEQMQAGRHQQGVIVVDSVVARQGDGENYAAGFKDPLHEGTEFELQEQRGNWLRIRLANGSAAWIPAQAAQII